MSLLDDNLDINYTEVFKNQIIIYLKESDVFKYRKLWNLPWFDAIEFKECNWDHIMMEPHKYYLYIKVYWLNLYIHIGKIHERLSGQKYGVDGPYIIMSNNNKYINIKQVLEHEELIEK